MALIKGTNAYATSTEADLYFADRLDVAAWTSATLAEKDKALVSATSMLDQYEWAGVAVSATQPLAFPRSGSYFDPRVGAEVQLTTTVPTRVVKACYELAYHLLNNDGLLDNTGGADSIKVGPIEIKNIKTAAKKSPAVSALIKPLLANRGSGTWWRAN